MPKRVIVIDRACVRFVPPAPPDWAHAAAEKTAAPAMIQTVQRRECIA
jgi:hypothetical protein